jgi:serine-protein kinase ATM
MIQNLAGFSSYLAGVPAVVDHGIRPRLTVRQHPLGSEAKARLNNAVFGMLQAKANQARSSWEIYAAERSSNVGDDVLSIAVSICIAIKANLPTAGVDTSAFAATIKAQDELWQKVVDLLTESKEINESRASLVCTKVLQIRDPAVSTSPILATEFLPFLQVLSDTLRQLLQVDDQEEIVDIDMMESMETRTSQGTQPRASQRANEVNRRELLEGAMANAFPVSYLLDLSIVSARAHGDSTLSHSNTGTVIDEFEALDAGPLLMARQSIYSLVGEQTRLIRRDAARLLKHLAETVLQADDYERSEAAMCCCAKVMTSLAPLWTSDSDDDLADCAFDIYRWFIEAALGKGIASPQASYEIALMLDSVSGLAPGYGSNDDMPSPRTSLLKILLNAPSAVKYQLSACLTRMFDRYILTEHGAIFNDIVEALPTDPDDVEGIAVRFHVLAELGSHWHTVLRQATYHLFETAIHVPKLTSLARRSLLTMAEALKLPSAKELFCAFAPQIFYTWLGNGQIKDLPFEAFGYPSLAALVRDNLSELVAQTALRGSKELAEELAGLLDTGWADLLDKAFAHAEAYCLASQTSLPDSEQLRVNSETLIRKDLSTDVYSKNLRDQLPSIISHLFNTIQDDHAAERAFEKAGLTKPLSVLKRIRGRSASAMVLPTSQQPSFRARFIVEEIGWLCKRIEFEFNGLWTSPILVHLYRQLLRSVNPVLGPLNAASVLRKIRMVVSLGEIHALRGYPLEMLLHNLRPFLTVFQCSEDAIGLYWYLLEAGSEHLQSNLSFLAGLGVSIFASLTTFILSSQESTTQESQYLSTMSKAKEFRKWLGRYLSTLEPNEDDVTKVGTFRTLVQHAKSMTGAGSSSKSSPEGNVLLQLLLDRKCNDPLLKDMHFYLSVGILCKDFIAATHPLDDISIELTDHKCTSVLQDILTRISLPDAFRTWVGSVIGRSYSAIGPTALHALPVLPSEASRRVDKEMTASNSYSAIIKCLEGLIWQEDVLVAAYSEQCLQSIATGLDRSTALSVLGEQHDQRLLSDVGFQDFPCPEPYEQASSAQSPSTLEHWHAPQDPQLWASTLVSTLCGHLANDPILGPLRIFAMSSPTAAGQLVPYVVHLILAAEFNSAQSAKMRLSDIFGDVLKEAHGDRDSIPKIAIEAILYLRHCLLPTELHLAQRNQWLDVDFGDAAKAAVACELWHEALLFVEVQQSQVHLLASRSSRRSTQTGTSPAPESLAVVFENVDDPDFFYAGHEDVDLSSVIRRLNHESSGFKMLSFQSAVFDAAIRTQQDREMLGNAAASAARALSAANLRGISQAVTGFANAQMQPALGREVEEPFFDLYDWNVHTDTMRTHGLNPMRTLQALTGVSTKISMLDMLDAGLLQSTDHLPKTKSQSTSYRRSICAIASLSEAREVLTLKGLEDFDSFLERAAAIDDWNQTQE